MNEKGGSIWVMLAQVVGLIGLLGLFFRAVWLEPDLARKALPDMVPAPIGGEVAP